MLLFKLYLAATGPQAWAQAADQRPAPGARKMKKTLEPEP